MMFGSSCGNLLCKQESALSTLHHRPVDQPYPLAFFSSAQPAFGCSTIPLSTNSDPFGSNLIAPSNQSAFGSSSNSSASSPTSAPFGSNLFAPSSQSAFHSSSNAAPFASNLFAPSSQPAFHSSSNAGPFTSRVLAPSSQSALSNAAPFGSNLLAQSSQSAFHSSSNPAPFASNLFALSSQSAFHSSSNPAPFASNLFALSSPSSSSNTPVSSTTSAPLGSNFFTPRNQSAFGSPSCTPAFRATNAKSGSNSLFGVCFETSSSQSAFSPSITMAAASPYLDTSLSLSSNVFGSSPSNGQSAAFGSLSTLPSSSSNSTPTFVAPAVFRTANPSTAANPRFGCGFQVFSTPASLTHPPAFDFSRTPLHCFLNFPSSQPSQPAQSSSTFTFRSSPLRGKEVTVPSLFKKPTWRQTSESMPHVCRSCGHTSSWGSRVVGYTPSLVPDVDPFVMLMSISAMPPYEGKSHEELRREDYQWRGKAGGGVAPVIESATFGWPLFDLPVLVFPVMPVANTLNPAFGSYFLNPALTTVAAFAPPFLKAPCTDDHTFRQGFLSFPVCEMFRQL